MLKNFILVSWRNILKQRLYSIINLVGLTVGITCFLSIYLYLDDELSYDRFHKEYEKIYRLSYERKNDDGSVEVMGTSGSNWGPRFEERIPEVEAQLRLTHSGYPGYVKRINETEAFMEPKFYWASDSYFEFFSYPLLQGDPSTILDDISSAVITESSAEKYFGSEDPIGKSMIFSVFGQDINFKISGVMMDPPGNTHLKPTFVANIEGLAQAYKEAFDYDMMHQDDDAFFFTYLKLSQPSAITKIEEDWKTYIKAVFANDEDEADSFLTARLTPIADMHLSPEMKWELEAPANASYIPIFSISALLVLIIACINFMNLATARSAKRAKEVGLRKTFGSSKWHLIAQFYCEAVIMSMLAVVLSIGLTLITLPYINDITDKSLTIMSLLNSSSISLLVGLVIGVGLIAGSYPALFLSSFRPMAALRGMFTTGKSAEYIRKGLVVFQFAIALILIISTVTVQNQMNMISSSDLGKNKDRILSVRLGGFGLGDEYEVFRNEVLSDARFESVGIGNHLPRLPHFAYVNNQFRFPELSNEEMDWNGFSIDYDFPITFDLNFIAGRTFDHQLATDSNAVILNEAAVKALNISAEDAIGMTILDRVFLNQQQGEVDQSGKIIGIVKDFPYKSVAEVIEPLAMWGTPDGFDRIMYIKMTPGDYQSKVAYLESKWHELIPGLPMEHWFLDYEYGRLYANEWRMSKIFTFFSTITILIAVLGLFALTSYTMEQRKKELGVRKVLGASNGRLVNLLIGHFLRLIALAIVIGIPIAWYFMSEWLAGFAYHVNVDLPTLLIAVGMVTLITLCTVAYDTIKTTRANPIKALRTE